MGRWMSPDRVNVTEERLMNPSTTLNKYAYAADNPLKYVDPDGNDITYFYDPGGVAGHAVLFAYNQANNDSAIESFGPAWHDAPLAPGKSMYEMDEFTSAQGLRDNFASLTIQTTPELTQQVIDYIRANPDPSTWFMGGPNCSSEVWKILHKFQLDYKGYHGNQGITPKALEYSLTLQYDPAHWKLNGVQGQDRGHPRFDMYNLMWMTIQGSNIQGTVTTTQQDSKDGVPIPPCGGDNPCNK
jgi:hypothetical protein